MEHVYLFNINLHRVCNACRLLKNEPCTTGSNPGIRPATKALNALLLRLEAFDVKSREYSAGKYYIKLRLSVFPTRWSWIRRDLEAAVAAKTLAFYFRRRRDSIRMQFYDDLFDLICSSVIESIEFPQFKKSDEDDNATEATILLPA